MAWFHATGMGLTRTHVACYFAHYLARLSDCGISSPLRSFSLSPGKASLFGMATVLHCSALTVFRVLARLFSFPVQPPAPTNRSTFQTHFIDGYYIGRIRGVTGYYYREMNVLQRGRSKS